MSESFSQEPSDFLDFDNPNANNYPLSLTPHARARRREEELRRQRANLPHFDEDEFNKHLALWNSAHPVLSAHGQDGIELTTKSGDSIRIRKDKVSVNAGADDATLRALVLHAKENWNNGLKPSASNKNEAQLAQVWAHCQVHGVDFGWQPSPEMAKKMAPEIARLRAQEDNTFAPAATDVKRLERDLRSAYSKGDVQGVKSALSGLTVVLADSKIFCTEELRGLVLQSSIEHGHQQALDAVLDRGVHVGARGNLAMRSAKEIGTPEMVRSLEAHEAKGRGMTGQTSQAAMTPRRKPSGPAATL